MRLDILGSAAALPDPDRYHTSMVLTVGERRYLIDCGNGATLQMMRANIDPTEINHIFLTHLHYDHIADFPYFMISTWMGDRQNAPIVFGPDGTRDFVDHLFEGGAFDADIRARAAYPKRQANKHVLTPDIRTIKPGAVWEDERVRVTAVYAEHIPREITECFAFKFEAEGKSVVFSSDTKPCAAVESLAEGADLLVHECTFPRSALEFRDKVGIGTSAHTSPEDLGKLASRAGVKSLIATHFGHFDATNPVLKTILTHHMPIEKVGPGLLDEMVEDIRRSYSGPLQLARDLSRHEL